MNKVKVRSAMAVIVATGFFGIIAALIFIPIPIANSDTLKILVGFVGGAFTTAVAFYFGDAQGKD